MTPREAAGWRRVLALEHEAVWTYGLVGARVTDLRDDAREAWTAHRSARDALLARLAAAGARTVGPRPAYDVPIPRDAATARRAAVDVERRLAAACVALVALAGDDERRRAVAVLRRASLAAIDWGSAPQAFPGLDRS
ncbi:MAG: DUF4439 domain-containing protein [Aeromicrobium erythreum]